MRTKDPPSDAQDALSKNLGAVRIPLCLVLCVAYHGFSGLDLRRPANRRPPQAWAWGRPGVWGSGESGAVKVKTP
jgi:hypothetical protein